MWWFLSCSFFDYVRKYDGHHLRKEKAICSEKMVSCQDVGWVLNQRSVSVIESSSWPTQYIHLSWCFAGVLPAWLTKMKWLQVNVKWPQIEMTSCISALHVSMNSPFTYVREKIGMEIRILTQMGTSCFLIAKEGVLFILFSNLSEMANIFVYPKQQI